MLLYAIKTGVGYFLTQNLLFFDIQILLRKIVLNSLITYFISPLYTIYEDIIVAPSLSESGYAATLKYIRLINSLTSE